METACTLLQSWSSSIDLGNTTYVGQDPNYDKTSLYPDMIISYRWLDNIQEYSCFASQTLQNNFTKRTSFIKNRHRNRYIHNNHNTAPSQVDYFVSTLQRSMIDMSIEVVRPFGIFSVLKIVLDRCLRAVLVLRGYIIEWVLVKGFDETFYEMNSDNLNKLERRHSQIINSSTDQNNCKLDIWTPSRYHIFRVITDHANAAILHFYAPLQMESAIKAYMVIFFYFLFHMNILHKYLFLYQNWLKSYSNLFSAKCKRCDTRLLNNMPPTWRDFRTNEPFHFECRHS